MRAFILMVLMWFFIGKAQSQEQYNDKGIYTIDRKYENWGILFFLDKKIIRQYNYIPRDYLKRLFINSQALDSNRLSLESFIKLKNIENRLYGTSYHTYNTYHETGYDYDSFIYEIDLLGNLRKVASFRNMPLMPGEGFYYTKELNNDSILYKVDPLTGDRTVFTETLPYVIDTGYLATGGHIFNFLEFSRIWQLSPTNYLMLFADCSADCSDYRYLLYDDKTKEYRKISRLAEVRKEEIKYYKDKNQYGTSFLDLDVVMICQINFLMFCSNQEHSEPEWIM